MEKCDVCGVKIDFGPDSDVSVCRHVVRFSAGPQGPQARLPMNSVINPPAQWISTSARMPLTGASCFIVYAGTVQQIAYKRVGIGFACADGYKWETACDLGCAPILDAEVTHWMPMPEPPKA